MKDDWRLDLVRELSGPPDTGPTNQLRYTPEWLQGRFDDLRYLLMGPALIPGVRESEKVWIPWSHCRLEEYNSLPEDLGGGWFHISQPTVYITRSCAHALDIRGYSLTSESHWLIEEDLRWDLEEYLGR